MSQQKPVPTEKRVGKSSMFWFAILQIPMVILMFVVAYIAFKRGWIPVNP